MISGGIKAKLIHSNSLNNGSEFYLLKEKNSGTKYTYLN